MNYAELTQAIQDFLQNDESTFVSQIPTFVEVAEKKIYRTAKLPATRQRSTGNTTTASDNTYDLPSGFLSPINFQLTVSGSQVNLTLRDSTYIKKAYPSNTDEGVPTSYAILDSDEVLLGPTPDDAYAVTLDYMGFPASIVSSSTSWLGTNAPGALLWGSICEAYLFLKGEDDLYVKYEKKFGDEVGLLLMEDQDTRGDRFSGDTEAG